MSDLIFHAGAECYSLYGTLSKRTSEEEDVAETFTRAAEANAGYFVDRAGVLKQAETDVLRTEWTGASFDTPNLLLEDARTNSWTFSEQLDNAAWAKVRTTITANAVAAPDGATTADKLVEDSSVTTSHYLRRGSGTVTVSTDQPISFFAKAAERTWLWIQTAFTTTRVSWFDLTNGVVGTVNAGHTITITALANGWHRITVVVGSESGTSSDVLFGLAPSDNVSDYTGDGSSGAYVWGIQFETDGLFASSYIQTVASTVTRNAETLSFPFVAPPQEMTVYVKFIESGTISGGDGLFVIGTGSTAGSDTSFFMIAQTGYSLFHRQGATDRTSTTAGNVPSIGDTVELLGNVASNGAVTITSVINSGTAVVGTESAALAFTTSIMSAATIHINERTDTTGTEGFNKFQSVKIARGTKTMAEMRALGV